MHPYFFKILDRLEKIQGLRYNFFTNLGFPFEFLYKIMTYNLDNFQASLHYDKVNIEAFKMKVQYILDNLPKNKIFRLSVMLDKDYEKEIRDLYDDLKRIQDERFIIGLMPIYWKDWYIEDDNDNDHMFAKMTLIDEKGKRTVGGMKQDLLI